MLMATRRTSSSVNTFACNASVSVARLGKRLVVGVAHDVAAGDRLGLPGRRESAGRAGIHQA
jgi:hypothetical protein